MTYQLDLKWRNECLSSVNSKWRQYKTHLTRTFIQPNRNNPKLLNKVPQGHCISPEDWSSFVINRMFEDFIVLHNITVAEYFRDGCTDPRNLLDALNKVKAIILYYIHEYAQSLSVFKKLFQNIEPIEEDTDSSFGAYSS
ncbi:hypothetical protein ZIOFF_062610 [Zingiber officinale]|uniref:Uncharacterized protein n=1 Tax=Zingiber officinale TaxID=94328 RepID=A0A8J5F9W4_ZINOF|nr:hypothetical protein ZIOFF_062610 [Zingiber officinale]